MKKKKKRKKIKKGIPSQEPEIELQYGIESL